jgi:hypothetical protein
MRSRSKKKPIYAPASNAQGRCVWCDKTLRFSDPDWVVDGNKQLLHFECLKQRLEIINANREKRAGAASGSQQN